MLLKILTGYLRLRMKEEQGCSLHLSGSKNAINLTRMGSHKSLWLWPKHKVTRMACLKLRDQKKRIMSLMISQKKVREVLPRKPAIRMEHITLQNATLGWQTVSLMLNKLWMGMTFWLTTQRELLVSWKLCKTVIWNRISRTSLQSLSPISFGSSLYLLQVKALQQSYQPNRKCFTEYKKW